jgi:hypothetical protein
MQTSQTASCDAWCIWQTVTSDFPVRILPLEVRCLLQDMQELSGATQMTLLITVLSLSALVGPRWHKFPLKS